MTTQEGEIRTVQSKTKSRWEIRLDWQSLQHWKTGIHFLSALDCIVISNNLSLPRWMKHIGQPIQMRQVKILKCMAQIQSVPCKLVVLLNWLFHNLSERNTAKLDLRFQFSLFAVVASCHYYKRCSSMCFVWFQTGYQFILAKQIHENESPFFHFVKQMFLFCLLVKYLSHYLGNGMITCLQWICCLIKLCHHLVLTLKFLLNIGCHASLQYFNWECSLIDSIINFLSFVIDSSCFVLFCFMQHLIALPWNQQGWLIKCLKHVDIILLNAGMLPICVLQNNYHVCQTRIDWLLARNEKDVLYLS